MTETLIRNADGSLRDTKMSMAVIFGIGFAVRMSLILGTLRGARYGGAETYNIALSLARNGTYADAYGHGVGPTAHIAPLLPIILAIIIRVAGVGLIGYVMQTTLAAIVTAAAFGLLPALAVTCRLGILPGVAAGLIGAIAPVNYWPQLSGIWDAPYTMLGLVGLCVLFSGYWIEGIFPIRGAILLGLISGILCLLNPTILQVLVGWFIFGALRFKTNRLEFFRFMAIIGLLTVLLLCPWAFRNFRTLGQVVWTRSDFGLELQVSNNDHATPDLERNVRSPDFSHPYTQPRERQQVRQLGELAYQQTKRKQALTWISSHRAKFIQLTVFRVMLFWFPAMQRWWQSFAEAIMTVLAVAGIMDLLHKKHPCSAMLLAILVFYPMVYTLIQVSPRYRLPLEPILILLGCVFIRNYRRPSTNIEGGRNSPERSVAALDG